MHPGKPPQLDSHADPILGPGIPGPNVPVSGHYTQEGHLRPSRSQSPASSGSMPSATCEGAWSCRNTCKVTSAACRRTEPYSALLACQKRPGRGFPIATHLRPRGRFHPASGCTRLSPDATSPAEPPPCLALSPTAGAPRLGLHLRTRALHKVTPCSFHLKTLHMLAPAPWHSPSLFTGPLEAALGSCDMHSSQDSALSARTF